jgi:hypothetical protein
MALKGLFNNESGIGFPSPRIKSLEHWQLLPWSWQKVAGKISLSGYNPTEIWSRFSALKAAH